MRLWVCCVHRQTPRARWRPSRQLCPYCHKSWSSCGFCWQHPTKSQFLTSTWPLHRLLSSLASTLSPLTRSRLLPKRKVRICASGWLPFPLSLHIVIFPRMQVRWPHECLTAGGMSPSAPYLIRSVAANCFSSMLGAPEHYSTD